MKRLTDYDPFLLFPAWKDYVWGGKRLNAEYAKNIPAEPLAETWECSTHPDGISTVASGKFAGEKLTEALSSIPGAIGHNENDLPVLIKLIDSASTLSVQVHPDDAYAAEHENGSRGKTETWYILDAEEDAYLYYGFSKQTDREEVERRALDGTLPEILNKIGVKPGDLFFIKPGTVHAIGGGITLCEIQQSSNITYRLYDWGRLGADGKPRELHLQKALDVIDYSASPAIAEHPNGSRMICSCDSFCVYRIELGDKPFRFTCADSFCAVVAASGDARITYGDTGFTFWKGDCVFVPRGCTEFSLAGEATVLLTLKK